MYDYQVTAVPGGRLVSLREDGTVTEFIIPVVGMSHEGRADLVRQYAQEGLVVFLKREPENPFDANAVKVCLGGDIHIGYVSRQAAFALSGELLRGVKYHCTIDELDAELDYRVPDLFISCRLVEE